MWTRDPCGPSVAEVLNPSPFRREVDCRRSLQMSRCGDSAQHAMRSCSGRRADCGLCTNETVLGYLTPLFFNSSAGRAKPWRRHEGRRAVTRRLGQLLGDFGIQTIRRRGNGDDRLRSWIFSGSGRAFSAGRVQDTELRPSGRIVHGTSAGEFLGTSDTLAEDARTWIIRRRRLRPPADSRGRARRHLAKWPRHT
jgi:hypothetical protein